MKLKGAQALAFIEDVRSGMSDEALMRKYNLAGRRFIIHKASAKDFIALQNRASQPTKRKISGREFINDVKSGMLDETLMEKYELKPRQLQQVFRQIIEAGLMTPMDLAKRLSITKSQVSEAFTEVVDAISELERDELKDSV